MYRGVSRQDQLQASTIFCQDGHDYTPRAEWKRKAGKTRESGRKTGPDHKDDEERGGGGYKKARFCTGEFQDKTNFKLLRFSVKMATTTSPAPSGSARLGRLESQVEKQGQIIRALKREMEEVTRRLGFVQGSPQCGQ